MRAFLGTMPRPGDSSELGAGGVDRTGDGVDAVVAHGGRDEAR